MNKKLSEFKSFIKNKKVAVLGVGISNKPLIRYIYDLQADITAFDMAGEDDKYISKTKTEFEQAGIDIKWSLGSDYLTNLKGFDIIFRTPKIRCDLPELVAEREAGAIITSEMEVFLECCPCKTIAVTGSDGKTTTTTMISLFLKQEGYIVHLGGNIGTPLLDRLDEINESNVVVLELSSFQLQSMRRSPDVAVITNITPNHLDVHKNFQEYIEAKKNIFLYQSFMGRLVLNAKDPVSSSFYKEARGEVSLFPAQTIDKSSYRGDFHNSDSVYYDKSHFYFDDGQKLPISEIRLPGKHNLDNYCAAATAVMPYVLAESMMEVMRNFGGVEHRNEFIRSFEGVDYYNSSIDSSPERTKASLNAFADRYSKIVLVAGGKDKNSDYKGLGEAILRISDRIILCGQNSALIYESLQAAINSNKGQKTPIIYEVSDYTEAVLKAREIAKPGEAVVLSPAGTSFDLFRNFEERGLIFKSLVNDLR